MYLLICIQGGGTICSLDVRYASDASPRSNQSWFALSACRYLVGERSRQTGNKGDCVVAAAKRYVLLGCVCTLHTVELNGMEIRELGAVFFFDGRVHFDGWRWISFLCVQDVW